MQHHHEVYVQPSKTPTGKKGVGNSTDHRGTKGGASKPAPKPTPPSKKGK